MHLVPSAEQIELLRACPDVRWYWADNTSSSLSAPNVPSLQFDAPAFLNRNTSSLGYQADDAYSTSRPAATADPADRITADEAAAASVHAKRKSALDGVTSAAKLPKLGGTAGSLIGIAELNFTVPATIGALAAASYMSSSSAARPQVRSMWCLL